MVNLGRPSKDCSPCRRRKLRCDLRAHGCTQCERAKLRCHGYRDPQDMAFRDETRATERKVQARYAAAAPASLDCHWAVYSRQVFLGGFLDGLSSTSEAFYRFYCTNSAAQPLSASVDALSLAFTACRSRSPLLMRLANENYVMAVHQLKKCLIRSSAVMSDDTLQSAMLLDMYEKMVNRNPQCHTSWMSHIRGAISIVQARLERHDLNLVASQLARRAVIAMTISCGAAGISVPEAINAIRCKLKVAPDLDVKWQLTALLVDAVNLRARLLSSNRASTENIAKAARIIDAQLMDLESSLPPSARSQRIHMAQHNPCVIEMYYDHYPDHFVMQTRNAIRITRLEMIAIALKHSRDDAAYNNDSALIDEIAQDICASVPRAFRPHVSPDFNQIFSPIQTMQCCSLLPPLYLAAKLSSDTLLKNWTIRSLYYMAAIGNIQIARDVADILMTGAEVSHWTIYAMVGCYAMVA